MAAPSAPLSLRAVSVEAMQRLDDEAVRTLGFPRLLLMAQAGCAVADAVAKLHPEPAECVVCCGMGYNGGDGLCAAWHLIRRGYRPRIVLTGRRQDFKEEPAVFARVVEAFQMPWREAVSDEALADIQGWLRSCGVILDALFGIGLNGPVRPPAARLIAMINEARRPVVAIDVPSGLDGNTGAPLGVAVHATVTVTFGAPKRGLLTAQGSSYAGRLLVDGLGMPDWLIRQYTQAPA